MKQTVDVKKSMRPSQNNLHLIRQSRQSGCDDMQNLAFASYNILFLAAKCSIGKESMQPSFILSEILIFYKQQNKL